MPDLTILLQHPAESTIADEFKKYWLIVKVRGNSTKLTLNHVNFSHDSTHFYEYPKT